MIIQPFPKFRDFRLYPGQQEDDNPLHETDDDPDYGDYGRVHCLDPLFMLSTFWAGAGYPSGGCSQHPGPPAPQLSSR